MDKFTPFPPDKVIPPPADFKDPASLSSPGRVFTDHIHLDLEIDLEERQLRGSATYTFRIIDPAATEVVLDVRGINVSSVTDAKGHQLAHSLSEDVTATGGALTLTLPPPSACATDGAARLTVAYTTAGTGGASAAGGALDWLGGHQTAGGRPYCFTQCQAVHARSVLPCQDTPAVKAPYTALMRMRAPHADLAVVMSAQLAPLRPGDAPDAHRFECAVPVPSYLLAFACGELASRDLSPRCRVWAEPAVVERAAWEFEEVEEMLCAAEKVAGPYVWGRYDLLVLPGSFPYGGMENPLLTFVTPTLLSGDRSLVSVVVHEIAHSWSGNLISCQDCRHFWINEGFTVKLERRILSDLYGTGREGLDAVAGRRNLDSFVAEVGAEHKYTSLVTKLQDGEDPDDYFSCVPYEKGYNFLLYLEHCVNEKGEGDFHEFLRSYFKKFRYQSITGVSFVEMFKERFPKSKEGINFDEWLHGVGPCPALAPVDTSLVEAASALATKWLQVCVDTVGVDDDTALQSVTNAFESGRQKFKDWDPKQKLCFLTELSAKIDEKSGDGCSEAWNARAAGFLDALYELEGVRNSEIRFAWCRLALLAGYERVLENVRDFLRSQGRMKFVRPLFADLHQTFPRSGYAKELYSEVGGSYHSIARKMIERDLALPQKA